MIVVADSSPLQYLIQVQCDHLLPTLYQRIILPHAVIQELSHAHSPAAVRLWITALPPWVELHAPIAQPAWDLNYLGRGEAEAIQIATENAHVDLILLDDRQARAEARRRGLKITGTLGVLLDAGNLNLIDPRVAYQKPLSETTFRTSSALEMQFSQRLV